MEGGTYHVLKDQTWVPPLELRDPPHAARPDHCARGKVVECVRRLSTIGIPLLHDQAVFAMLALKDRPKGAAIGQRGRDILQAMDEHVDLALQKRHLELLGPERLSSEKVERLRLVLVTLRRHEGRAECTVWERALQRVEDNVGLDLCKLRRARCEHDAALFCRHDCYFCVCVCG